jgi:hypothetical protein
MMRQHHSRREEHKSRLQFGDWSSYWITVVVSAFFSTTTVVVLVSEKESLLNQEVDSSTSLFISIGSERLKNIFTVTRTANRRNSLRLPEEEKRIRQ